MRTYRIILLTVIILWSCKEKEKRLPILGERQAIQVEKDGKVVTDTLYHTIPAFRFINQDSVEVTEKTFEGKIYVTDFFFTTCPSICPKMKQQMLRVYEKYKNDDRILLLSHSISREDSVPVLRAYAKKINISSKKWHLVTGKWNDIEQMAKMYFVTVTEDKNEPGGYLHSGHFALIDKQRRIRGIYEGTNPKEVDKLLEDIDILLNETP
ncbi:MAG: SCO family protein [Raineya sp.]|nr:SCO family protein [Raineya sp.]MDW8295297.1 SCO family protein [Raineya sp.]